jgi:exopolysaccharide biosynthesis polyprenyl glycosylphosphotransferase
MEPSIPSTPPPATAEPPAARASIGFDLRERLLRVPRPAKIRASERDLAVDVVMLGFATGAMAVSASASGVPTAGVGWVVAFPTLVLVLLGAQGIYTRRIGSTYLDDVRGVVAATVVAAVAVSFIRALLTHEPEAASQALRGWLFAVAYLSAGRAGLQLADLHFRRKRGAGRRTLIVGAGRIGHLIVRRLSAKPETGLTPVCFLDDDPIENGVGLPILNRESDVARLVREYGIEHAILSFSSSSHEADLALSRRLRQFGVSISVVPRLFEDIPDRVVLDRVVGLPMVSTYPTNPRGWHFTLKYVADRVLAFIGLTLLSPILLATSIGILLTLGRPILFRQTRVRLDGREFEMLKFRTMRVGSVIRGSASSAEQAILGDVAPGGVEGPDRRTRFGSFLRRTSLDELPQLFNVLRGEMSLVGPRPERDGYVHWFERSIPRYSDRHRVKPGITGWSQVHGLRGKTSLMDRVEWDNYYIENWSLWLDIKILLLTMVAVVRDRSE